MNALVGSAALQLGVAPACAALGLPRATYYRTRHGEHLGPKRRRGSPRALSRDQGREVLEALHEERFVDLPPAEVYSQLLDEGTYLCSIRTMYRLLASHDEVRERRQQRIHLSCSS